MRVCSYKGLTIAVLTRNEHCPPHVHVGSDKWEARFEFSFWHNGVCLRDVMPVRSQPTAVFLEEIRQTIKQPIHLRRARELWWRSSQTICLVNQLWDMDTNEVVDAREKRLNTRVIKAAHFDAGSYKTALRLSGQSSTLEIEL